MSFFARLEHATDIQRHEDGTAWTWRSTSIIHDFTEPLAFTKYVESHISELKDAVVFTGSASMITRLNAYLADELKKRGLL